MSMIKGRSLLLVCAILLATASTIAVSPSATADSSTDQPVTTEVPAEQPVTVDVQAGDTEEHNPWG
ncbi:hypothetical protein ACWCWD_30265 [Streptomyces sp. NPDC001493]